MTDIRQWLEELGLGQYADAFDENEIDRSLLPFSDFYITSWLPLAEACTTRPLSTKSRALRTKQCEPV